MNIFFLDESPLVAARDQHNKHVVKMVLESAQLLSSVHHMLPSMVDKTRLYKLTHKNHPMAVWARKCPGNYHWLAQHAMYLCFEYTQRYRKVHASQNLIGYLNTNSDYMWKDNPPNEELMNFNGFWVTQPPLCMPDKYKVLGDCVASYRAYYKAEKVGFAKWRNITPPNWLAHENSIMLEKGNWIIIDGL